MFLRIALALALIAGLGAALCSSSRAASEDRRTLVVSGRVVDHKGWPIERAKITARGSRSGSASSDAAGRFQLDLALGPASALAHGAIEITIEARAGSDRLVLPDGRSELRLSIRVIGEPGDEARAEIRASQADVAATVARGYAEPGGGTATLVLAFARPTGGGAAAKPAGLGAREEVALVGVRVPGSKKIVSASAQSDTAAAARERQAIERQKIEKGALEQLAAEKQVREKAARDQLESDKRAREKAAHEKQTMEKQAREMAARDQHAMEKPTREQTAGGRTPRPTASGPPVSPPSPPVVQTPVSRTTPAETRVAPKPTAPPTSVTPPERNVPAPCGCRLEGTIEVQSDRPLSRRLPLIVRLRDQPACRDTVELFMGSPRVFEISGATCGTHVIDVEIPERERFRLANPASERTVTCVRGALRQVRLILLPR